MFHYQSTHPAEIAGTIRVREPIRWLGPVTDIDGVRWDVRGIIGGEQGYVWACRESELHSYYSSTLPMETWAGQVVTQRWEPYRVEVQP